MLQFCDVIAAMLNGTPADDLVAKYNPKRDAQKKIKVFVLLDGVRLAGMVDCLGCASDMRTGTG